MATAAITSVPNISAAASSLKLEDLLRVLLTELTSQNPLKPVDNKDFMAQVAQFASLNASQQLNQGVEQLVALQALSQSVGLLGKDVSAVTGEGVVRGKVTTLTMQNGVPQMTLTTSDGRAIVGVSIGQIQTVQPSP